MSDPTANEQLRDAILERQAALLAYGNGLSAEIIDLLGPEQAALAADLRDKLALMGDSYDAAAIQVLLDQIQRLTAEIFAKVETALEAALAVLVDHEVERSAQIFNAALPVGVDLGVFQLPSPELLSAIVSDMPMVGSTLSQAISDLAASQLRAIRGIVQQGLLEGQTIAQMVREVIGTKAQSYEDGVLAVTRRQAEALVITSVAHVTNQAREAFYRANTDVIASETFTATLDSRTTPLCRSLDGRVYPVGEGPIPPLHFRCRSVRRPNLKSWRQLGFNMADLPPGSRASMDGQVPGDLTYDQWLRGRSARLQDEILGPTRGALYRKNPGMTMRSFVNNAGKTLTLEQLSGR